MTPAIAQRVRVCWTSALVVYCLPRGRGVRGVPEPYPDPDPDLDPNPDPDPDPEPDPDPDPDSDPDPDPDPDPNPDPTDHGPPREVCLSVVLFIRFVKDCGATSLLFSIGRCEPEYTLNFRVDQWESRARLASWAGPVEMSSACPTFR